MGSRAAKVRTPGDDEMRRKKNREGPEEALGVSKEHEPARGEQHSQLPPRGPCKD